ncbi:MAG: membrane protein insertase YidC, partial [Betaproteobacteria bacterium]
MDERRLLLAVALSLVVLTAYSLLFAPPPPQQPVPTAVPTAASARPAAAGAARPPAEAVAKPQATPAALAATPVPAVADERERRVEVVAPAYVVAFTNRGARLVSWALTNQRDAGGRPEEMVAAQSTAVRPLDLETGDAEIDARLRGALFLPSAEELRVSGEAPQVLRFEYAGDGIFAEKAITFRASGLVAIRVSVRRAGQTLPVRLLWGPGLGNPTP